MENKYVIGIDAGGTKVAYGLFNKSGFLVDRFQHPTDIEADGPSFCDGVLRMVHEMLQRNDLTVDSLEGIGICMPSFILFDQGYVCMTSAMTNIKDFAMRDYFAERLPVPVVLDNDSNVAALAEHKHGAGCGSKHMIYMATSTGIGSGIIINEKLFRGNYGWAGESGHMLITPNEGILCGCGNKGCFMSYASGRYIPQHVSACVQQGTQSVLADCEALDCTNILEACKAGDALAVKAVEDMAHYIAVCTFNIYQLLNINLFVFGGGLVNFGDELFGRVRAEFDRYNHIPQPVYFRFAELGKDFGIIGAAELILDK